ncbi:MAG: DUF4190 domain-containing protein [Clostridia bacterium]|nr:DUF4190 domain-containing protein [Clostridia bacterium]
MNDNGRNPYESGSGDRTPSPFPEWNDEKKEEKNDARNASDNPYVGCGTAAKDDPESGGTANDPGNPYVDGYYGNGRERENDKGKNGTAIAAMVLGIVSLSVCLVCCCFTYLTWIISLMAGVAGTVLGIISLVQSGAKAKAVTGLVLSVVAVVLSVVFMVALTIYVDYIADFMRENYPDVYDRYYGSGYDRGMIVSRIVSLFKR